MYAFFTGGAARPCHAGLTGRIARPRLHVGARVCYTRGWLVIPTWLFCDAGLASQVALQLLVPLVRSSAVWLLSWGQWPLPRSE